VHEVNLTLASASANNHDIGVATKVLVDSALKDIYATINVVLDATYPATADTDTDNAGAAFEAAHCEGIQPLGH
jgi:hypothetical protein